MKNNILMAGVIYLAFIGTSVQAHNDMCDYNMDYDLTIENYNLDFAKDAGNRITIDQDNQLFINGNQKQLDYKQQQLLDDYADGVRDLIPEITTIAIEGVNLGLEAATMALSTLLGESDPDIDRFNFKLNELAQTITEKLDAENFSSKKLEEAFDSEFENQIEVIVEEAITELTPKIVAKIITAAMSGEEGEISDWEQRAEFMENEIENYVEPRAEALETRADELCESIDKLDALESKMVDNGLEMMDLINQDHSSKKKYKGKHFNFDLGD